MGQIVKIWVKYLGAMTHIKSYIEYGKIVNLGQIVINLLLINKLIYI